MSLAPGSTGRSVEPEFKELTLHWVDLALEPETTKMGLEHTFTGTGLEFGGLGASVHRVQSGTKVYWNGPTPWVF